MNISAALNLISFQTPEAEYLINVGGFSQRKNVSLPEVQSWRFNFSHFFIHVNQVWCTLQLSTLTQTAPAGGNFSYLCSITSFPVSVLQKQCYCAAFPQDCLVYNHACLCFSVSGQEPQTSKKTQLEVANWKSMNTERQVSSLGAGELGKTPLFFLQSMFYQLKE